MNQTGRIFYYIGLVILGGFLIVAILQTTGIFVPTALGFPCAFRSVTGLYCPGCGGTHAVCSFASGHLFKSFTEHPFVPYVGIGCLLYVIWNTLAVIFARVATKQKEGAAARQPRLLPYMHFHFWYIYLGLTVLLFQWIIKNILIIWA